MSEDKSPPPEATPACFFLMGDIDESTKGYEICVALENVSGEGSIVGGQELKGVFRIYCANKAARNKLVLEGVDIGDVHVTVYDQNPKIVDDAAKPSEKLIVGHIPLSVATAEIDKVVKKIDRIEV